MEDVTLILSCFHHHAAKFANPQYILGMGKEMPESQIKELGLPDTGYMRQAHSIHGYWHHSGWNCCMGYMYLRESRQKRADGSVLSHLQLAEDVWDPAKKRSSVRIVYNYGRSDDPKNAERLRRLARNILKRCTPGNWPPTTPTSMWSTLGPTVTCMSRKPCGVGPGC